MPNFLLGIDYGTGGAKACIIDEKAEILSYAFQEYPIFTNCRGWAEHDPNKYWGITRNLIKKCIFEASIDPKDIKGIGTSSALPSMVMINREGEPINMAYNLMDRRATEEVKWLKKNIGLKKIFEISGNRLEDHPLIVNLMWEKNNRFESFKNIYKALTIDGYIRYKLTGKTTTNYSAAAFYGVAYDISKMEFNNDMLEAIGLSIDILPDLFSCEDIIGEITLKASEETGLKAGIPVAGGQVDCNSGWLGGGAIEVGDTHINLGTCGVLGVIHDEMNFLDKMVSCSYTINSSKNYVTIAVTTTGGLLLRYVRDNFSNLELAAEKIIDKIDVYDIFNMNAEKIKPGSEGLMILPYLMGERTPIWNSDARGVIFGLSLNHSKWHIIRAMMESVAYALYDSYVLIVNSNKKINYPIVMNEGGAKSKLWRRIITDVFNAPTVLLRNRTGAPYGDAILAGVSSGIFKDYRIVKEKAKYDEVMEPIEKNHRLYMEYFHLFKNLYRHLEKDYIDLSYLRQKY